MTIVMSAPCGRAVDWACHGEGRVIAAARGPSRWAAWAGASVAAIVLLTGPAAAQTWNGNTSTDWTEGSNWSGGVPPTSANVVMTNGRPAVLGINGPATGSTGSLLLGGATGSLTIQNGSTLTSTGLASVGSGAGANVVATVKGPGSKWTIGGLLNVGGSGTGVLNIENGGVVGAQGGVRLGLIAGVVGTINVNGGSTLETTGFIKGAGTAQVTFDNATLRALASNATFTGTLTVNELVIAAGGLTVDTNGFAIDAEGFSGVGGLGVVGTGTLTLADISTYAGATRIGAGGTLVIDGDHAGTGNHLHIETALGDDSSVTGRFVVAGNTTGTTNVTVTNRGGVGGVTTTGIKIIDVGGTSDGLFNLLGDTTYNGEQAVIGGAYLYGLYQDTGDGDWYLRTIIDDEPVIQPAAPVIEAYVAAALQAFNTTESLQQRIGNRTWSAGDAEGRGIWGRIEVGHLSIAPGSSTTGASYDVTTWQFQAGLDGVLSQNEAGTLVGGVNAQFGTIAADIASASGLGGVASTGYGLGTSLTWYGSEGFYLDAQGKLTWFDSALSSDTLGVTLVSGNAGFGYALSLEAGQEIGLGDHWSVTPQAQLTYSAVDFDDFASFGSTVALESGDGLLGRLGISVDREADWQDTAGETGRTRLYGIANLTYEFLDGTSTSIGGDTLTSRTDPAWGGVGLGASVNWAGNTLSLYGEANVGTSLSNPGDSYSLGVTAGLRGRL
ncbi:autotransporter outer membrane beta-barrel domain-containing protein [Devosia sp. ZB163]|uniref:autotransporter family protein n=1 Tax=Devosia sp. ZB163 TaxID=3025938 RepID=UPI0023603AFC|nr:autotransporter outer membrane beta-barrel domain-containing protein [Devosia sp. ZB163]MDC9825803.1 autotransporter outer membrane beta-barrel domain-containing protein [Devosia sp. ZB163]